MVFEWLDFCCWDYVAWINMFPRSTFL
uniref:Uncharacterized protein n=1 Tax=Rhizophora mucronata TaxID=61149 RepID=A0A2P2MIK5_RHIMU